MIRILTVRRSSIRLIGNTSGLKASPLRRLERLANRRTAPEFILTPDFARALTEISREIQRQVGVLVDRLGHIRVVMVGDTKGIFLPDLSDYRRGWDRLCGLRLLHTHLNGEPLSDDDLTDLALLRLDYVTAIEVLEDGLPGKVFSAHLLPHNDAGQAWEVLPPTRVHDIPSDFHEVMDALEDEFSRVRKPRRVGDNLVRAIVVHVSKQPHAMAEDSVGELKELCRSAGIEVVHEVQQRRPPDTKYVMGQGKLKQTMITAMQLGAELLVFDLDLSPAQLQSVSLLTDMKILDRTQVILDIFAQHAETREGKIQVELAQLRYLLPRLRAKQTASALSRLTGGIGGRGPGETKLEVDRRRATDRIARLEREIKKLGGRRKLRRSKRTNRKVPVVSIVGYTNAGKSTLLNALTQSTVKAENALFATLNPVSRRLRFPREREIVITDTVGFIRDLPKDLMAAFRTTLEELDQADLLVHVLDSSRHDIDDHHATVQGVLKELGIDDKPCLVVLNKSDKCDPDTLQGLIERYQGLPMCALDRKTFKPLLEALEQLLWADETLPV
jgi:GTP-binding protein HflX